MSAVVPIESIARKIVFFRGEKVLLDRDLAELYGVENKQLKRAVRRHISRFPQDFMFELTKEEFDNLRCQIDTSSWGGLRSFVFSNCHHIAVFTAEDNQVQSKLRIANKYS